MKEGVATRVAEFCRGPHTAQITVKVHSIERSRVKEHGKQRKKEENRPAGRFLGKGRAKLT